ncbi:MAG TPA: hypothetical protein VML55_23480 [Planctomycetaceae bacterium]|nr:hypothetical protein [Planctomycetaceae bacterium]
MTTLLSRFSTRWPSNVSAVLRSRHLPHAAALAGLAALVLLVYLPAVGFGFVNWDDPWYVQNNPLIKSWHPAGLWRIVSEFSCRNYAPLTTFSLLIDHTLWGDWAGGYHLTNIALHLTNAVLVYLLLARLTSNRFVAWAAAALFAVHPVHIESVAWISSRKGLLSAAFILASLLAWLRPVRTHRHEAAAIGFLVLALLAKAIAVVLPAVMLAWDRIVRREPLAQALPRQIVPGLLSAMILFVTMSAQTSMVGGVREHLSWSMLDIVAVDLVILWRYVGMLVWPAGLNVLYDVPAPTWGAAVAAAAGWAVVTWHVWRRRRTSPLVAFAALGALVFLLPVLNLTPLTTLMNDRYLYLPSVALFALAAAGLDRLAQGVFRAAAARTDLQSLRPAIGMARVLVAATLVIGYAAAARVHLPVWQDGLTLWRHAARNAPDLAVPRIELAHALHAAGKTAEAVAVLENARLQSRLDHIDRQRIEARLGEWTSAALLSPAH